MSTKLHPRISGFNVSKMEEAHRAISTEQGHDSESLCVVIAHAPLDPDERIVREQIVVERLEIGERDAPDAALNALHANAALQCHMQRVALGYQEMLMIAHDTHLDLRQQQPGACMFVSQVTVEGKVYQTFIAVAGSTPDNNDALCYVMLKEACIQVPSLMHLPTLQTVKEYFRGIYEPRS